MAKIYRFNLQRNCLHLEHVFIHVDILYMIHNLYSLVLSKLSLIVKVTIF